MGDVLVWVVSREVVEGFEVSKVTVALEMTSVVVGRIDKVTLGPGVDSIGVAVSVTVGA